MNIATALNRKYIRYTIVMLTSSCINNSDTHIDAYLLHSELTQEDVLYMGECLGRYDITLLPIQIDRNRFDSRFPTNNNWTVEMYYRLFLCDLLPSDIDRVLYLDVDMIVNKPLDVFYNMEFGKNEIIGTADSLGIPILNIMQPKQRQMFQPMLDQGFRYINSGMMLMNMDAIRAGYSFDTYLAAMEEWGYEMSAPDQDILNYVHWQKIAYVDPYDYDLFAYDAHSRGITYADVKAKSYIVHFVGNKPWKSGNIHFDIEKLWWEYARKTPFYLELLEEFLEDTLTNINVENYFRQLIQEKGNINMELKKSLEINRKLVALLNRMQ